MSNATVLLLTSQIHPISFLHVSLLHHIEQACRQR